LQNRSGKIRTFARSATLEPLAFDSATEDPSTARISQGDGDFGKFSGNRNFKNLACFYKAYRLSLLKSLFGLIL
jgi:hypothetical protein